jgi:hypothetical protein
MLTIEKLDVYGHTDVMSTVYPLTLLSHASTGVMLLRRHILSGIHDGTITLAFRRWRRPTVRAGGTLLTAIGQLHITAVSVVAEDDITEADAKHAGYSGRDELLYDLNQRNDGTLYRITFGTLVADPRLALRASVPDKAELVALRVRLDQMDARTESGAWTRSVLSLIASHPGTRAEDLAGRIGMEKLPFKARVRKLKALGLTESLEVGYRLSPRGEAILNT